jgi:hypothetical protein
MFSNLDSHMRANNGVAETGAAFEKMLKQLLQEEADAAILCLAKLPASAKNRKGRICGLSGPPACAKLP